MRVWPLSITLTLLLLAGCIDGTNDPDDEPAGTLMFHPDWAQRALPTGEDHDHTNATQHQNLSTPNFEITGWDPLTSPTYGNTPAGYLCGDAVETDDGRRLAAIENRQDIGFTIADVTDPRAPKWLGELVMPHTYVYDLAVVPDGKHVALVTSNAITPDLPVPAVPADAPTETDVAAGPTLALDAHGRLVRSDLTWYSPCAPGGVQLRWAAAEDPVPRPVSLLLVDITDPADPTIVDQRPIPGFGHSAFSTHLDDRYWVMAATVGPTQTQTFQFYEVLDTPLGGRLNHLSTYNTPVHEERGEPGSIGGHTDGWIAKHPLTDKTTGYLVGGWDFITLDLTDPLMPKELGYWTDVVDGRSGPVGNLHSAFPMRDTMDGRHYTIIGPEFHGHPQSQPSGTMWVLDTTDPTQIDEVAAWTLPVDGGEWAGSYMNSNHYLTVYEETAFISMYHAGVWAVDLSVIDPANFTQLPSIGVFMPANVPSKGVTGTFRWTPTLEEVLSFEDGTLVTFDSMSGIYTFRFDPSKPAPPPEPWPIEPVP